MFFRRHKKGVAFVLGLFLAAVQLHGIVHLFGSEDACHKDRGCELCQNALAQNTLAPEATPDLTPLYGFLFPCSNLNDSLAPRFSGSSQSLRGPPVLS